MLRLLGKVVPRLARERHLGNKIHRFGRMLTVEDPRDAYTAAMSVWDDPRAVVVGATRASERLPLPAGAVPIGDAQRMMLIDAITYLPDDILVKVDRASMGVSLEARVPFLDPRVAELCWSLPVSMKIRHGERKWLLRRILRRHVPAEIVDRPKTGFAVPIGEWLRGPMRSWATDLLSPTAVRAQGYFHAPAIASAWQRHLSGREDLQDRLWCALMFQSWLETQPQTIPSKANAAVG
jgi:asparagine synthase (glutamine-hydrolysing)